MGRFGVRLMMCDECERILLDWTSAPTNDARASSVSLLTLAESHTQSCPECASRSADLARLHAALEQLRDSTSQMEAPARVETNLLAAFRQSTTRNASFIGINLGKLLLAPAAALLLLVSAVTLYMTLRPRIMVLRESIIRENKGSEQIVREQPSPVPSGVQPAATTRKRGRTGPNHTRPLRPADNLAARANLGPGQMTQQIRMPVGEQLALNGGSSVIRVNLPLSSLAAVGVPMYPDLPDRQVTADVAVDPFGAIIAIRLVGTKPGEAN